MEPRSNGRLSKPYRKAMGPKMRGRRRHWTSAALILAASAVVHGGTVPPGSTTTTATRKKARTSSSTRRRRSILFSHTTHPHHHHPQSSSFRSFAIRGGAGAGFNRDGNNHSNDLEKQVFWECLPTGTRTARLRERTLWAIPVVASGLSFYSFPWLSYGWLHYMQWASHRTWIPQTKQEVELQTNVVASLLKKETQVVNGPVITSISVLFASLVGLTISNFHQRQIDVHRSMVAEVHNLRALQTLLGSPAASASFSAEQLQRARALVQQHSDTLFSPKYSTAAERKNAHAYIESGIPALILWCNDQVLHRQRMDSGGDDNSQLRRRDQNEPLYRTAAAAEAIEAQVRTLAQNLMNERGRRWMALQTAPFPMVHFLTLTLLALSIVVSFLVATAQAEFIFLRGLPVRLLWSVLITSFTALGVVCFDLARPFRGAYHAY